MSMATYDRDVLPDTVKPTNYAIDLFDVELGGAFSYKGFVKIDLKITKGTNEVVLNAIDLKIHDAMVQVEHTKTQETFKASEIKHDEKTQRVHLVFPGQLPVSNGSLSINFTGTINNSMVGFYRSKYKPVAPPVASVPKDGDSHVMFSTQFESSDARRAFPCFDEPNLKATFEVTIEIPQDQVALSNMPEKVTKDAKKAGFKVVTFEKTPIMSTYLLAWAFGDFEYVEDFTRRKYNGKSLPVRVYTTKGLKEQGKFALENAHQIVDYFSEVFRIDYPLPKVDLLAVHEFSHGAMENWGLITYRTTAVLYDEAASDERYKNRVAYVVAHELAHQWFGNLVTMDWWSELWLNEGFATWVGWLAIDHLFPHWNVWGQFITGGYETAFQLDSLRGSHPIEVPVKDALEIDQIFDHISYFKGSSVIRMLSAHLGEETFLLGVSNYLKTHKYGNATTTDLWAALSDASKQNVNELMDNWIRKIGFPVVTVAEEPGQITVRQSRFLSTGDVEPQEDQTLWWIPLGFHLGEEGSKGPAEVLTIKENTIRGIDDTFYKLNAGQTGFYRTNYPAARLAKLGAMKDKLTVEDKIGLIGDAAALALAGEGTTTGLLAFIEGFSTESSYLVWSQITSSLTNVRSIFADDAKVAAGLKKFTLKLVTPAVEKIGWEFHPHDDFLTGQLRALLINTAGTAGHEGVISEAQRRFKSYTTGADKQAIHPNLRLAIFRTVIAHGDRAEYDAVKNEYLHTTSVDGKEICLASLGRVQSPTLLDDFLDFAFSPAVSPQDLHTCGAALARNPSTRLGQWEYLKAHWDAVHAKLGHPPTVLDRFLKFSLNQFASFELEQDIATFFADKDTRAYDRGLAVIADSVRANARYRARDAGVVEEWLAAHGYL